MAAMGASAGRAAALSVDLGPCPSASERFERARGHLARLLNLATGVPWPGAGEGNRPTGLPASAQCLRMSQVPAGADWPGASGSVAARFELDSDPDSDEHASSV